MQDVDAVLQQKAAQPQYQPQGRQALAADVPGDVLAAFAH
jgi:hypothetical protein